MKFWLQTDERHGLVPARPYPAKLTEKSGAAAATSVNAGSSKLRHPGEMHTVIYADTTVPLPNQLAERKWSNLVNGEWKSLDSGKQRQQRFTDVHLVESCIVLLTATHMKLGCQTVSPENVTDSECLCSDNAR